MVRLLVTQHPTKKHAEIVTGISWSGANELMSVADDKKVWSWNVEGEPQALLLETDTFCTELRWFPSLHGGKGSELFVVGCTDGSFKLIGKSGRVEKVVTGAHNGAVTTLRWSNDGQSLATSGEDGQVKSWSRNGMFRAHLAQAEGAVYTLCWSAESEQILFSSGKHLVRSANTVCPLSSPPAAAPPLPPVPPHLLLAPPLCHLAAAPARYVARSVPLSSARPTLPHPPLTSLHAPRVCGLVVFKVIRPLTPSSKQTMWRAHDAPVLSAEWNAVNNLIVSGGEDCKYRVWDCYGRQLYSSMANEYAPFIPPLACPPLLTSLGDTWQVLDHRCQLGPKRPVLCGGLLQHAAAV